VRSGDGDRRRRPRPLTVRPRRAVLLAGGAFGTPELLLRSGLRSPGGQLGRNLRIHPACWVGARFGEEVRGWDGVMQSYGVTEWEPRGILLEATFTPLAFGAQWLPGTGRAHQERVRAYGLYVADGSLLPSSSGVNPMMTIIAMASRVAHQMADRLA